MGSATLHSNHKHCRLTDRTPQNNKLPTRHELNEMASWPQRSQRSQSPPKAAVRQRSMACNIFRCGHRSQDRLFSRKRLPCARMMSATSRVGRLISDATSVTVSLGLGGRTPLYPVTFRPPAVGAATGEGRWTWASESYARAALGPVGKSAPCSTRCVAKPWRGRTGLVMPARCAASRQACQMIFGVMGLSARQPLRVPGNR